MIPLATTARFTLVAASMLTALAGSATAADLRGRAPVPYQPPPPPPPVFSWSGCYIGGYVGGAGTDGDPIFTDRGNSTFRAFSGGFVGGRAEGSHSWNVGQDSSFIGGGTLGCNWQAVGSPFVLGIEGEAGYMKLEGSTFDPLLSSTLSIAAVGGTPDVLGRAKIGDWYGMITGRLGYAWGSTLLYVKGGAAFVPVQASVLDQCAVVANGCGNWLISTSDSKTITTATLGGGLEWAFASNWSVKAEYMFIGLGDRHVSTTCGFASLASGATVGGGQFCFDHEFPGIHTAKIGLNYRFGGFGVPY
jgi:outer membrane immunogenic protein